ncbi:leucine-rich repeats and immunoglobulin-like domains protein 2 isoform X2 [Callorhinchus milii]|uniref:leucine-rich repeats and immunoglobulin-like domains protein 2 isoform X2 n=1 Tax=Callorhinchus milii TaxID=7868 RepID=UPI001C3F796D|nr:leucine-rich repeats and immunoglobulin-like domains protein 2 isoform X2 [Callorhinchus milii]
MVAVLLLLVLAAWTSPLRCCPSRCACGAGRLDCSAREAAPPQHLPPWVSKLDLSHKQLHSTKEMKFDGLHRLQEVKMNYNELSTIPSFGAVTSNLTLLSLKHNQVFEIIAADLQPYSSLETFDLSFNSISEVTTSSFPIMQLKYLHLNNNRVTFMELGCFDNLSRTLLVLKLNRNRITVIQPKTFRLPQLQYLELKRNRIRVIESLTFQGLDSLKSLKLKRNGICELKDGAFWGLNEIEELDLEDNNLTEVTKGWLYGLKLLQRLHLSQNAVARIRTGAWEFCQKLSELDLTYNQLTRLDESTFLGLNLLESLYLGDNRVSYIADRVFTGLSNLLTLDLRNNEISWAIEDSNGAFSGLEKLNKLILQGSKITSITRRAFTGLEALEYLDLSNNSIMSVQANAFTQMKLKELRLNTSSLLCDCQLRWLPQWLLSTRFEHQVHASCGHPAWLTGRSIFSVAADNFICDDFPKPQITVQPKTMVALRGRNVSFTCSAGSSSDSPMATVWRKDSEVLYDAEIQNYSRVRGPDGEFVEHTTVLQIHSVNFTDEGRYQCVVTNYFGSNYSNKAKLTVNELPSFLKTPMDLTIRTGAMARLECAAEGHPVPQIAWQKDGGTDFPAARERRMHVMPEDDVFFIAKVKSEDMGMYSCTAQNAAGTISANATLTILETPSFMRPLENRTVAKGETAVLQCIAGGSPPPRLNWTKDDGPLAVTDRHFFVAGNQLLIIVDAGPGDVGKYTCVMSNTLGTARGHIYLNVVLASNCNPLQKSFEEDGWTTIGIVIIVVVVCVVGTSLVWVIVIYHMRRKSEEYRMTSTDEMNLPADIPSYLSSQGTLSEPQEGYSNSEAGSHQQLMASTARGYIHKGMDGSISGPLVICSDCYDGVHMVSRSRDCCPCTHLHKDQPSEHLITNITGQLTQENSAAHEQHGAVDTGIDLSGYLTNHNRICNPGAAPQHSTESCSRCPWSLNMDLGLLARSCYSQQAVTAQVPMDSEDEADRGVSTASLSHRSSERTLAVQLYGATT